ncbi:MAG: hypothetical protein WBF47_23470, partial [Xanthobacteraceae bacterium]
HDIKSYDPLKSAREDVENIGKELNKDLDKDFAKKPLELMTGTEQKAPPDPAATSAEASSPAAPSITESSVTESSASEVAAGEPAAPPLPAPELKPEPAAIATPESAERTG